MENLTRSVSKKSYGGTMSHKSVYDDVFGGPPKYGVPALAPRLEDYSEIFGGFHSLRGLSIPILDLPVVDEAELSVDARSSSFDYTQVFGGFNGLDFAASLEDLLEKSNGGDYSSDDEWSPAQSESLSDESDPSASSERSQSFANADTQHRLGDGRQFNISYHEANQRNIQKLPNKATNVTKLHAIPGHACMINENLASEEVEDAGPSLQASVGLSLNMDSVERTVEEKQFQKCTSLPTNSGLQTHQSDLYRMEKHNRAAFTRNHPFVTVNDISLRTKPSQLPPPSRPPPVFAVKEGETEKPNSKLKTSNSYAFERVAGDHSPPFYDVEIDASSSKVASAAMKDAMEKAQARIRIAKESMEKKDILKSYLKLQGQDNMKITEEKISKTSDGANSCKDAKIQGVHAKEGSRMEPLAAERRKATKMTEEVPQLIDGEGYIDITEKLRERRHDNECRSSDQVSHKFEGTFAWRQATEYFEVVETDMPLKAVEQHKDKYVMLPNIGSDEYRERIVAGAEVFKQEENFQESKAAKEAPKLEGKKNQLEVAQKTCELDNNMRQSEVAMVSTCQDERQKKVKVDDMNSSQSEISKQKVKKVKHHLEVKKLQNDTIESVENLGKTKQNVTEVAQENPRGMTERTVTDTMLMDIPARKANESRNRECFETEECDKSFKEAVDAEKEKQEIKLEERNKKKEASHEKEENKKKQKGADERTENGNIRKEGIVQYDDGNRLKETIEHDDIEDHLKRTFEQVEIQREKKLDCKIEDSRGRSREAHNLVENEKIFKVVLPPYSQERLSTACERGEADISFSEVRKPEDYGNRLDVAFEEEDLKESSRLTTGSEQSMPMSEDADKHEEWSGQTKHVEQMKRDGDAGMVNLDQGIDELWEGENNKVFDMVCEPNKEMHATLLPGKLVKNVGRLEATEEAISGGEDEILRTEFKDREQEPGARTANLLVEESSGKNENELQSKIHEIVIEDVTRYSSSRAPLIDPNEAEIAIGSSSAKLDMKVSAMTYDPEKLRMNTHGQEERERILDGVHITVNKDITKDKFKSHQDVKEKTEKGKKIGAASSAVLEDNENTLNPDRKRASKNGERKEKILSETLATDEREIEERALKEKELAMEHQRMIEEEKEREREREKDRMAVDRATLEARDRSFAEVREKAERAAVERAAAEVRQRAMAEARGRLEKASMVARERSLADKASMEARLRAERAAVERATAEARQRAFEKAMNEKASSETRERVERSFSDKFSASSRSTEIKQSSSSSDSLDLPSKGAGTSNVLRYSYSSAHAGVEGESPQRCKARLERYRRTAERAAKALAEKNMRDLLAQREQAERNRLAEVLDAEVKRWSSGKEGNLRALLSTLQYILGPDSGWQPVPLTEVITSASVKRAYRKATLCVHPDKLQQRGASIQQKYICEKVFDLLKEAWNTFNSEER